MPLDHGTYENPRRITITITTDNTSNQPPAESVETCAKRGQRELEKWLATQEDENR